MMSLMWLDRLNPSHFESGSDLFVAAPLLLFLPPHWWRHQWPRIFVSWANAQLESMHAEPLCARELTRARTNQPQVESKQQWWNSLCCARVHMSARKEGGGGYPQGGGRWHHTFKIPQARSWRLLYRKKKPWGFTRLPIKALPTEEQRGRGDRARRGRSFFSFTLQQEHHFPHRECAWGGRSGTGGTHAHLRIPPVRARSQRSSWDPQRTHAPATRHDQVSLAPLMFSCSQLCWWRICRT